MKLLNRIFVFAFAFTCLTANANAGLLDLTLTQNGNTATKSFNSILDLAQFDQSELQGILSGYNENVAATLNINYRGVPIVVTSNGAGALVATMNGTVLYDSVKEGKSSSTRAALDGLADKFKDNPTEIIDILNAEAVKSTPFDPVAGNPSSFLYRMQDSSYNAVAYDYTFRPNLSIHNLQGSGKDASVISLNVPLGFTFNFTQQTGLTFDLPITANLYDGSLAGDVSAGLTWRQGILSNDTIVLSAALGARGGVAASLDLGTAGIIWSVYGALNTKYMLNDSLSFRMINSVGYYNAPPYDLSSIADGIDMRVPYDFTAIGLKNSIAVSYNFTPQWLASLAFIDNRFVDFDQYISYYEEIRLSFEFDRGEGGFIEDMAIYAGYKFGEHDYDGFEVGFGFNF